jgi:hypothetical protein
MLLPTVTLTQLQQASSELREAPVMWRYAAAN